MTKLKVEENTLKQIVIPNLNYAINKLSSAIDFGRNLVIPSGFKQSQKLNEILDGNTTIKNDLTSIKEWICESDTQINNVLDNLEKELNTIKNIEIKKRESIVKNINL